MKISITHSGVSTRNKYHNEKDIDEVENALARLTSSKIKSSGLGSSQGIFETQNEHKIILGGLDIINTQLQTIKDANLGNPVLLQSVKQGDDSNDKAVMVTDFLGEVQEGIQSLTSAFKDYKPNDDKKEDAITNDMRRLLKAFAGTLKVSRDPLSTEDKRKASGLLRDLSFSVDNMFDALLDIKREDFRPIYRGDLSEDFCNLGMFASFLTEWVHSLIPLEKVVKDGGFWKHIINIFEEAASSLDDSKAAESRLRGNSNQKKIVFTQLASHQKDDNKPVDIIDFLIDTKGAVTDVSEALKDYKAYGKKEEAIDKAMDKLDEIFDLSHNFTKHELSANS